MYSDVAGISILRLLGAGAGVGGAGGAVGAGGDVGAVAEAGGAVVAGTSVSAGTLPITGAMGLGWSIVAVVVLLSVGMALLSISRVLLAGRRDDDADLIVGSPAAPAPSVGRGGAIHPSFGR